MELTSGSNTSSPSALSDTRLALPLPALTLTVSPGSPTGSTLALVAVPYVSIRSIPTVCSSDLYFSQYDYVCVHWYDVKAADFKTYVTKWHDTYNKPVFITEFAPQACSKFRSDHAEKALILQLYRTSMVVLSSLWMKSGHSTKRSCLGSCKPTGSRVPSPSVSASVLYSSA